YDRCSYNLLGIEVKRYNKTEITQAASELDRWRDLSDHLHHDDNLSNPQNFEQTQKEINQFIADFPASLFIPDALYDLAIIFESRGEYSKALSVEEELSFLYPKSKEAIRAFTHAFYGYRYSEKENAFELSTKWLNTNQKTIIAAYSGDGEYIFYSTQLDMYKFRVEYFRQQQQEDKARQTLFQMLNSPLLNFYSPESETYAKGALYDTDQVSEYESSWPEYIKSRIGQLVAQAIYIIDVDNNLMAAEEILTTIANYEAQPGLASILKDNQDIAKAKSWLRFIEQLKLPDHQQLLLAFNEDPIMSKSQYLSQINPQRYPYGYVDSDALYRQFTALAQCKDVEEVRLASFDWKQQIDSETEIKQNYYFIIFKSHGQWHIIDNEQLIIPNKNNFLAKNADEFLSGLGFMKSKTIKPSSMPHTKDKYPNLFRAFYKCYVANEINIISTEGKSLLNSIQVKMGSTDKANERLQSLAKGFLLMPLSNTTGLAAANLNFVDKFASGQYDPLTQELSSDDANTATIIHELAHHWDMTMAVGNNGADQSSDDPSLLFYKISWDAWSEASCGRIGRPCNGWVRKANATEEDFSITYGMSDGFEDLATAAESYVLGGGDLSRERVRNQMKKGNFEPAAKYLFNKYIRSFDATDGLCLEYNIADDTPALSFKEVKTKLSIWSKDHPGTIDQNTLNVIAEIEATYLKLANRIK
ncbi:MAG: hypothetical protein WC890_07530, partial [Candidatus Margulisiibacteriota bacterium]